MSLFSGSQEAYGVHVYLPEEEKDQIKKKGKNYTEKSIPKPENYADHLNGIRGIGIIPVVEGTCKFCEIDIDVYGEDLAMFVKAIYRNGMPLIPFRSKSGGLHLCTFYKDFIDADVAISNARRLASLLSVDKFLASQNTKRAGAVEIFPKQKRVDAGAKGSWINLPYYYAEHGTQCAIGMEKDMSFDEFLVYAQKHLQTVETVKSFFDNLPFQDAPPCLQTIYMMDAMDYTEGRNNYLFSFGTYLKKAHEEFWESKLYEINSSMSRPLPIDELEATVMQSLRKKDYSYMCSVSPCVLYCNKAVCKTREYGVGKDLGYFSTLEYGELVQYKQDQPYYEWMIREQGKEDWVTFRFRDETEIIGQDRFLQLCVRFLHVLPPRLKAPVWAKIVNQGLQELRIVDIAEEYDVSPVTVFKAFFYDFVTTNKARTKEQVSLGRVWYEKDTKSYMFRATDCLKYVKFKKNFTAFRDSEFIAKFRDIGAFPQRMRIVIGDETRQISVWSVTKANFIKNVEAMLGESEYIDVDVETYAEDVEMEEAF